MTAARRTWTEQDKDDDTNDPAPATHVITGSFEFRLPIVIPPWVTDLDDVAAELMAAWADTWAQDGIEWGGVQVGHPARDVISAEEPPSSPGAMWRIQEVAP